MILNTDGGDILVEFGRGDIIVSPIKTVGEETEHYGIRFNWSKKPHIVGDDTHGINVFEGSEDVYAHPAVNLVFTKKESIDVVMHKLEEMKKFWDKYENSSIQ